MPKSRNSPMVRRQLDARLRAVDLVTSGRPRRGWVHTIRYALDMSSRQLAHRLGISQSAVIQMEQAEMNQSVTLATLQRAAEALDCDLVYALVPRKPLDSIVKERARELATEIVSSIDTGMVLEEQGTSIEEREIQIQEIAHDLINRHPRELWETE